MLKGSEIKEKSIIIINGAPFFVAFKSNVVTRLEKTIIIGLSIKKIIEKKFWPITDSSYDFLTNYVIDESGISCDNEIKECRQISGLEKMQIQTLLIKNGLSQITSVLN